MTELNYTDFDNLPRRVIDLGNFGVFIVPKYISRCKNGWRVRLRRVNGLKLSKYFSDKNIGIKNSLENSCNYLARYYFNEPRVRIIESKSKLIKIDCPGITFVTYHKEFWDEYYFNVSNPWPNKRDVRIYIGTSKNISQEREKKALEKAKIRRSMLECEYRLHLLES